MRDDVLCRTPNVIEVPIACQSECRRMRSSLPRTCQIALSRSLCGHDRCLEGLTTKARAKRCFSRLHGVLDYAATRLISKHQSAHCNCTPEFRRKRSDLTPDATFNTRTLPGTMLHATNSIKREIRVAARSGRQKALLYQNYTSKDDLQLPKTSWASR